MLSLDGEAIAPASANQSDEACADVYATGFWGRRQGAFFDIRDFTLTHLATSGLSLLRFSGSMKWRRKGSTGTKLKAWSMAHLLHLLFEHSVALVGRQLFSRSIAV